MRLSYNFSCGNNFASTLVDKVATATQSFIAGITYIVA